jgi:SAM-dependent methyltransferase
MFFEHKIKSIHSGESVLEIGPGATPYFRSDIFLEKVFASESDLVAQSGNVGLLKTDKPVVTYDGNIFPFSDKEFDYVICSHVLEHVDNVDKFLNEVQRVGKKGYLEFPTIYYDYIYNFPEHTQFLMYQKDMVYWMPKKESSLSEFLAVQQFFYKSCRDDYYKIIDDFKPYFFQGFEWFNTIKSYKTSNLNDLVYKNSEIDFSYLKPVVNYQELGMKKKLKDILIKIINKL